MRESLSDPPDQRLAQEFAIKREELAIERDKIAVAFAQYGFRGILTTIMIGSGVVLGLAILNAFTPFKIETWALVAIAMMFLIGTIAFGFLSLWELPRIAAKFRGIQFTINPDR